ncbi:hypothetical protein AWZ03_003739 [Drosophila navojoa]|uniref:MSP domain-containing protein n=1 Tax=Drosophila navojoa TaxID=7232 RepID=A0A484BPV2_DRONA|nr:uncharacterized protein LOC115562073 [Drosophila navojoa]TDG49751.1 hypothetical protein AWZ03_003739 [Drosophila navojoa]
MARNDVLIVSPLNVKFQSPFPHIQKRQLSLLNLGPQPVDFSIDIGNTMLFQVQPTCGRVSGFDTIELSIIMQPVESDQWGCSLAVKHRVRDASCSLQALGDWKDARVTLVAITLEDSVANEKELLSVFSEIDEKTKGLFEIMEKQYQPLCQKCSMKRFQQSSRKRSKLRHLWCPLLVALISLLSYYLWVLSGVQEYNTDAIH